MKRVAYIIFDYFKNDSRVLKQCRSLVKDGYDVSIYCFHKEGLNQFEEPDKIKVYRKTLWTNIFKKNLLIQILQFFEFFIRVLPNIKRIDIINSSSVAPLPMSIIMKFLSFGRIKVLYDAREFESHRNDLKGFKGKLFAAAEKYFIRYIDDIITVSDSIANEYLKLYGIKPKLVLNCPPIQSVVKSKIFHQKFGLKETTKIFLYQGVLGDGRGINVILESFLKINNDDIALVFMGYGYMEQRIKEKCSMYHNIFYCEAVSPDKLLNFTAAADVGLCLIENTSLSYYYCLPNKFFEYAMAQLPILVTNLYELNKMVVKYKCGQIIENVTVDECLKGIKDILDKDINILGINARKMAEDYSWENQEKALLSVYNNL